MINLLKKIIIALMAIAFIAFMCAIAFLVSGIWNVEAAKPVTDSTNAVEYKQILGGSDASPKMNYTCAGLPVLIVPPAGERL